MFSSLITSLEAFSMLYDGYIYAKEDDSGGTP